MRRRPRIPTCRPALLLTLISLAIPTLTSSADNTHQPTGSQRAPIPTNNPDPAFNRVAMIGASATAGFTVSEPLGGPKTDRLRLDRYWDAALDFPHGPARNFAHALFFLQPEPAGKQEVDQALALHPTLVVATDFLFWFCYGEGRTDADRLKRFEGGLKLLDNFDCPIVVGDLPDASATVNIMLLPEQMPSPKALAAANTRLKSWAASRKSVFILPLSQFMSRAVSNLSLTVHGQHIPADKTRAILQDDRLHPTQAGAAVLALAIIDLLQSAQPEQFAGTVNWDRDSVLKAGSSRRLDPVPALSPESKAATPLRP
ncbi:MAG: hypothetical protein U1F98_03890 [Verrucomicrobiota bacterium]